MFESLDKPALHPLPARPYEFAIWKVAKASIDYHVAISGVYYSVPYPLVGRQLDVRLTQKIVEIFFKGKRVASHPRAFQKGQYVTEPLHRPKAHQAHAEWTPSRLISWGQSIGPNTGLLVERILVSKKHPEQGYRSCLGLLRLSKQYSQERMEAAALRALTIGAISYRSVKSILDKRLEQLAIPLQSGEEDPLPMHENVRGASYYQDASGTKKGLLH